MIDLEGVLGSAQIKVRNIFRKRSPININYATNI